MMLKASLRVLILLAVIAANSWLVSNDYSATSTPVVTASTVRPPAIWCGTTVYDSLGNFLRCEEGRPVNCIIIKIPLTSIYVSKEGVKLE